MSNVSAFEVSVVGTGWTSVVHAASAGKAKAHYWRHVTDPWPDIPFTAVRCRRLLAPQSSEEFIKVAVYRGLPDARCGDRVRVGRAVGTIVGYNCSANFDVLFDDDSQDYAGERLNVHPASLTFIQSSPLPAEKEPTR